jgi:hypothetical protein
MNEITRKFNIKQSTLTVRFLPFSIAESFGASIVDILLNFDAISLSNSFANATYITLPTFGVLTELIFARFAIIRHVQHCSFSVYSLPSLKLFKS